MIDLTVSHYKILEKLGQGGMGVVYRAEDTKLKRTVALKLLSAHMLGNDADRARFYREARAAAGLQHPNIATVYEIDEVDDKVFFALEFIDGKALDLLIEEGPLPIEKVIEIATQVAEALHLAHEHHVVHRDVKSANIMLTAKGRVKVLDFGLAKTPASTKLTQYGSTLGTIAYMSPEQAQGMEVDHRTDIWSLGVVMYEMITGKNPFPGDYEQAVIYGIQHNEPKPPTSIRTGVPMDLEQVVDKCLRKDRDLRYQHADDLVADLKAIDLTTDRRTPELGPSAQTIGNAKPSAGLRWTTVAGLIALALIVGALIGRSLYQDGADQHVTVKSMFRVTSEAELELDPALSPDGTMIAYVGGVARNTELFVKRVSGGNRISVAPSFSGQVSQPVWSPDGSSITFRKDDSIYLVPALGGTPEPFLLAPRGSAVSYHSPIWSPDGKQLVAVLRDSLFLIDRDNRSKKFVASILEVNSLAWSPDGSKIAGSAGNSGWRSIHGAFANVAVSHVWVYDIPSGGLEYVTDLAHQNESPAWDKAGRGLFFLSNRGGGMDVFRVGINNDGSALGDPVRVTVGLGAHTMTTDPSGSQAAVAKLVLRRNVWRVPIEPGRIASTREAEQITFGANLVEALDVSPDGTRLVYDSDIAGNQDLYLLTIGETQSIRLTDHVANDFVSTWVDSRRIVFYSLRLGARDIYMLDTDTREVNLVLDVEQQAQHPEMTPDGRRMVYRAFASDRIGSAVIVERSEDGTWGAPRTLTSDNDELARWSPTGDRICVVGSGRLSVVDSESGVLSQVEGLVDLTIEHARWSSDGKTIFVQASDRGGYWGIWAVDPEGGEPQQIVTFDDPGKMFGYHYFAVDRGYVYLTLKQAESDIWMLEFGS